METKVWRLSNAELLQDFTETLDEALIGLTPSEKAGFLKETFNNPERKAEVLSRCAGGRDACVCVSCEPELMSTCVRESCEPVLMSTKGQTKRPSVAHVLWRGWCSRLLLVDVLISLICPELAAANCGSFASVWASPSH